MTLLQGGRSNDCPAAVGFSGCVQNFDCFSPNCLQKIRSATMGLCCSTGTFVKNLKSLNVTIRLNFFPKILRKLCGSGVQQYPVEKGGFSHFWADNQNQIPFPGEVYLSGAGIDALSTSMFNCVNDLIGDG